MTREDSKYNCALDIYMRLCEGKIIYKQEEVQKFGVSERTFHRYIKDINTVLAERAVIDAGDMRKVSYKKKEKGYILEGYKSPLMENSEILAVSKILLESRAFTKGEISDILEKLTIGCVPQENRNLVKGLIANEKEHYVELHNQSHIKDKLWGLGVEISRCNLLEIVYQRQGNTDTTVKRIVQPVAILFSEYYFYLNAYIMETGENGRYKQKYSYPAVFRIDRILKYKVIGVKGIYDHPIRFQEGEFRKRVQFMYAGELVRLQFRYTGNSVEAILDRLPTARVISKEEAGVVIKAEVYGKGALMWLLSQGKMVEVLKPDSYRQEMKNTLMEMLAKYQNMEV